LNNLQKLKPIEQTLADCETLCFENGENYFAPNGFLLFSITKFKKNIKTNRQSDIQETAQDNIMVILQMGRGVSSLAKKKLTEISYMLSS
jgi:hypothetical protein